MMDLKSGIAIDDITDGGMVAGKVDDEDVVLVRRAKEIFAVGANCTHYHGPLAEGIVTGDSIHCPDRRSRTRRLQRLQTEYRTHPLRPRPRGDR